MPTLAQIEAASSTLTAAAKAHAASLIKSSARYQADAALYPDLDDKLDAAGATVKAQQVNAALALIDALGDGTVRLKGGDEAVDYDRARDREQLVDYMIDVLFDSVLTHSSTAIGRIVGSRTLCPRCLCTVSRFRGGCLC